MIQLKLNGRKRIRLKKFAEKGDYGTKITKRDFTEVEKDEDCNLISSLCEDGLHRPVIDFDFPCQLIPSSTDGHYHLYIDKEMGWNEYEMLLEVLVRVGLVEQGYYNSALKHCQTYVRPPWVKKGRNTS